MALETKDQSGSNLMCLPLELRLNIYERLFGSTTLTYGKALDPEDTSDSEDLPEYSSLSKFSEYLSILVTCRQIFHEASPLWPRHITFRFLNTSSFVYFLGRLPQTTLVQIRHVVVKAFPIPLSPPRSRTTVVYSLDDLLPLFPGLQLEVLTVHDCYHDPNVNDGWGDAGTYNLFESLIKSRGWKTLHFYSPTSEFLNYRPATQSHAEESTPDLGESDRWPQPFFWEKGLRSHDGIESGASAKIYRAKESTTDEKDGTNCAALVTTGDEFSRDPWPKDAEEGFWGDLALANSNEIDKEVIVIAKRGAGAYYTENGSDLALDLKLLKERWTWDEIQKRGLLQDAMDDPCAWL